MDRYRVAPARPVFLSPGATHHHHVQALPPPLCGPAPAGRRSDGAELDIFTAERYFNAADSTKYRAATVTAVPVDSPPAPHLAMEAAASQSGRTAASSEASWNSRSGLLASSNQSARQQQDKGGYGGGASNGGVVEDTRDDRYHRAGGKKPAGQRWGLFSRVDCPCVGRKAVTVGVASEPPSPRMQHASSAMDQEISAIFKANRLLPPPSLTHEPEPSTMKIISTTGSCAFPLHANKNNNNGIVATPAANKGASFDAFPAPDIGRRVVVSSSGAAGFTFPVIAPATNVVIYEPPRESLEVFRPIDEDSVVLADDPPPPPSLSAAGAFLRAPAPAARVDEDATSDASSDLFDLESFAASSSYPTTCRGRGSSRRNSREEDDDLPYASVAAMAAEPALSECMYAPSEASVVWSVATAEGFAPYDAAGSVANFSSAASACGVDDFVRFVQPAAGGGGGGGGSGHDGFTAAMSRSAGRKKGGFLNSCRCEKAVSVGPTPVRVGRPRPPAPAKTAMALESGGAARYHHGRVHMPVRT